MVLTVPEPAAATAPGTAEDSDMNRLISTLSTTGKRFILDSISLCTIGLIDAETGRKCRVLYTFSLDILPAEQNCFCDQPELGRLSPFDVEHLRIDHETLKSFFTHFMSYAIHATDLTPAQVQQLTHGTITLIEPVPVTPRQLLIRNGIAVAMHDDDKGYFVANEPC